MICFKKISCGGGQVCFLLRPISLFSAVAFRAAGQRVFRLRSMFRRTRSLSSNYARCMAPVADWERISIDRPSFCALCKASATQPMPIVFCRSGASEVPRSRKQPTHDRRSAGSVCRSVGLPSPCVRYAVVPSSTLPLNCSVIDPRYR